MGIAEREQVEAELLGRLHKLDLIPERGNLDDILGLSVQDLMERRLQTVLFRKGMAKSFFQSRQLISHGHIAIGGRKKTLARARKVEFPSGVHIINKI